MEKLKMALGFLVLPFAFCLFVIDRIIMVITPQLEHPKFNDWLKSENIIYAFVRVATIGFLRLLVWWIFGV